MESLRDAILLNNTGVHQLDCGNIEGALQSFQCAVASVKIAISISRDPDIGMTLFRDEQQTFTEVMAREIPMSSYNCASDTYKFFSYQASKRYAYADSAADSSTMRESSRVVQLHDLHGGCGYLYNRPLFIPTDIIIQSTEHVNSLMATTSSYIILNFALACHLVGKSSGKDSYLIRALRLYELTLKVLDSVESHHHNCICPNNEMHMVLECLALNNLAQLCYEQCDYKLSQNYMDMMYELLMNIHCTNKFLNENEMEEIMLNLVYLQAPSVAKAA